MGILKLGLKAFAIILGSIAAFVLAVALIGAAITYAYPDGFKASSYQATAKSVHNNKR